MNPFDWKREHQVALLVAAAVGAFVLTVLMFHTISRCAGSFIGSTRYYPIFGIDWGSFLGTCWLPLLGWPIVGTILGSSIVYVRQLLRP